MERKRDTKKVHKFRTKDPSAGVWQGSGRRGRDRLATSLAFSQSPLLSGPDTTEKMGIFATFYTGIPGMHLFLAWLYDQKPGNLISSS